MMKYIFVLAVGLNLVMLIRGGAIPVEFEEAAPDIRKFCQEESGVSTEILEKGREEPLLEDPKFKCYLKCQLSHFGVITRKGLQWNTFTRVAPPSIADWAKKIKEHCADVVVAEEGGDLCELAYRANKCSYETSPSEHFLI